MAFYNLENLFDTIHDAGKNDQEFLPTGSYKWTAEKYEAKLGNMARVLSELSRSEVSVGPAFIGVAEVENYRVLDDLLAQPSLRQYRYIHYEGPDKRGIDCALLYDPRQFKGKRLRYDHHQVFRAPYLFEQEGKYKGTILRTHAGRKWLNGYSDHLPTIVYLRRGR